MIDPETLDQFMEGAKVAAGLATVLCSSIGIVKLIERKCWVDQMIPVYESGGLNTKPNVFNIYKMTDPKTCHNYCTNQWS